MQLTLDTEIDYYYIDNLINFKEFIKYLKSTLTSDKVVACDTEVRMLHEEYGAKASWRDPHTSRVSLFQLYIEGEAYAFVIDVLKLGIHETKSLIEILSNSSIRKLFVNCLPLDTQVLTPEGWRNLKDISVDDTVMGYKEGKQIWTKVTKYIDGGSQEVIETSNSRRVWRSTLNHRWLCEKQKGYTFKNFRETYYKTVDLMNMGSRSVRIRHSAPYEGNLNCKINSKEAALMAWIWGDESYYISKNKYLQCTITQSKNNYDYCERIESLINDLGIKKSVYTLPESPHILRYGIPSSVVKDICLRSGIDPLKPDYSKFILSLSKEALEEWVLNFWYAEGDKGSPYPQNFCQTRLANPEKVEMLLLAGHLLGYTPKINGKDFVAFGRPITRNIRLKHRSLGIQNVACLETETSNFVIRQGDFITITGNSKFDLKVIYSTWGIWLENAWCISLMSRRIGVCTGFRASQMRGHSYKAIARDYFGIDISKTEQASDWSNPNRTPSQLKYSVLDVAAPKNSSIKSIVVEAYRLFEKVLYTPMPNGFGGNCKLKDYNESIELDQEVNLLLAQMEYRGIPVSKKMLDLIYETAKIELEELKLYLCKSFNLPIQQRISYEGDKPFLEVLLSEETQKILNSPKKLVILINKALKNQGVAPLTDVMSGSLEELLRRLKDTEEVLEESIHEEEEEFLFEDEEVSREWGIELIDKLLKYKELVKLIGTDYRKLINPVTGRVHSSFQCIGASTGRMSSGGKESFNCQQISSKNIIIEVEDDKIPYT